MMKICQILLLISSLIGLSSQQYITFGEIDQCRDQLKNSYTTQNDEYSKEIKTRCYDNHNLISILSSANVTEQFRYQKFYSKNFDFSTIYNPSSLKAPYENDYTLDPMKGDLKIQYDNFMKSYEALYDSYDKERNNIPKNEAKIEEKQLLLLEKLKELKPIHFKIINSQELSYKSQQQYMVAKYICDELISKQFKEKFDQNSNCFIGKLSQEQTEQIKLIWKYVIIKSVIEIQEDLNLIENKPFIDDKNKTNSSKIISLGFMLVYFILITLI